MNTQPEALRLADYFDRFEKSSHRTEDGEPLHVAAAAELRRLHEVNAELLEAAKLVLSHKRGEDDWLILAVHCRGLEAAIAKVTEGEANV